MTTYQRRTKDISDFRERAIIRQRQSQFGSLGRHRHDWVTHDGQAAVEVGLADDVPAAPGEMLLVADRWQK